MGKAISIGFAVFISTIIPISAAFVSLFVIATFYPLTGALLISPPALILVLSLVVQTVMPVTFFLLPPVAALIPKRYGLRAVALILAGGLGGGSITELFTDFWEFAPSAGTIAGGITTLIFVAALAWWEARVGDP